MSDDTARTAALAALVGPTAPAVSPAGPVASGIVLEAGGDVEVLLLGTANLGHPTPDGHRARVRGYRGDVARVTEAQAERLIRLGAARATDTALDESEDEEADDAQLDALSADDLKALAGTSVEAATRVLAYESAKAPSKQRPTVIEAANATLEDDGNA